MPPLVASSLKLLLRQPDLDLATRIAAAVNSAVGPGTASAEDPGAVALKVPQAKADSAFQFLATIDTLPVVRSAAARIVIDGRDGTVVTGGDVAVLPASVSHHGLTVQIGGNPPPVPPAPPANAAADGSAPPPPPTVLALRAGAKIEDIAAGLHAAGANANEIAAIFDALRSVQALSAEVVVR